MQFTINEPSIYMIEQVKGTSNYAIFKLQKNKGQTIKRAIYIFKNSVKKSAYSKARQYILEEFGEQNAEHFARVKSYEWVSLWNKI
ncbi:MAG: hypothetical protein J6J36_06745 [Clostridia bacterium]|nr:hypothetical protein [Clostridia bacterium]